jgi:hypothetical protein
MHSNQGLIKYRRGQITVIDRIGVEACCCECCRVVCRACDRLPGPYARTRRHPRLLNPVVLPTKSRVAQFINSEYRLSPLIQPYFMSR